MRVIRGNTDFLFFKAIGGLGYFWAKFQIELSKTSQPLFTELKRLDVVARNVSRKSAVPIVKPNFKREMWKMTKAKKSRQLEVL